jgi:alkylation response protein AidB-like acyl-CoA dehydrogenase
VAYEFDRNETFDQDLWRKTCELGFVGVYIDEKYGGAGYGFFGALPDYGGILIG